MTSMKHWCHSIEIPHSDDLNNEIMRNCLVFKSGLFGTDTQLNFTPKLYTFNAASEDIPDRVLVYSQPSEEHGQTVKFFICKLEQTVMEIRNAQVCLDL